MSLLTVIATLVAVAVMTSRGSDTAEVLAVLGGGTAFAAFMLSSGNRIADEERRMRAPDHQGEIVALLRSIDQRIEGHRDAVVEDTTVPGQRR